MMVLALFAILTILVGFAVIHCCGTPMTRTAKAGWVAALVLLPGLGLLAYIAYYTLTYRLEYA